MNASLNTQKPDEYQLKLGWKPGKEHAGSPVSYISALNQILPEKDKDTVTFLCGGRLQNSELLSEFKDFESFRAHLDSMGIELVSANKVEPEAYEVAKSGSRLNCFA